MCFFSFSYWPFLIVPQKMECVWGDGTLITNLPRISWNFEWNYHIIQWRHEISAKFTIDSRRWRKRYFQKCHWVTHLHEFWMDKLFSVHLRCFIDRFNLVLDLSWSNLFFYFFFILLFSRFVRRFLWNVDSLESHLERMEHCIPRAGSYEMHDFHFRNWSEIHTT